MAQHTQAHADRKQAAASGRNSDVHEFLDRFASALTAGDGRTLATLWEMPALVLGDHGAHAISSPQEVEQFFSSAKDQYHAQGITDTQPQILKLDWVTDRLALVEVRWPYLDAQGAQRGEEISTYTLKRDEAGHLRLRVAVMHGAKASH